MQRLIVCSDWLVVCVAQGVFHLMNKRHGCHICYKPKKKCILQGSVSKTVLSSRKEGGVRPFSSTLCHLSSPLT
jgi:hypothetical protein